MTDEQMMIEMTMRAKQARELASKATAGEWRVWGRSDGTLAIYSPESTNLPAMDIAEVYDDDSPSGNAAFIAASRALVPQLADDVLALTAEIDDLRKQLDDAAGLKIDLERVRKALRREYTGKEYLATELDKARAEIEALKTATALIAERESVCVWQSMGDNADWVTYSTGCNDKWAVDNGSIDYTCCPSCGRKIKIG